MVINLDPVLKARIDRLVEERGYAGAAQLLADALDSLEIDDGPLSDAEIAEMKTLIDEADADGTSFTADEVRAYLNETFAELDKKFGR